METVSQKFIFNFTSAQYSDKIQKNIGNPPNPFSRFLVQPMQCLLKLNVTGHEANW
jgi:hypothetical protein